MELEWERFGFHRPFSLLSNFDNEFEAACIKTPILSKNVVNHS